MSIDYEEDPEPIPMLLEPKNELDEDEDQQSPFDLSMPKLQDETKLSFKSPGPDSSVTVLDTDSSSSTSVSPEILLIDIPPLLPQVSLPTSNAPPSLTSTNSSPLFDPQSGESNRNSSEAFMFPLPGNPPSPNHQRALAENPGSNGGGAVKRYLCQRCLNHGEHWPRKGHKPFCRWSNCFCQLCKMVDERRRLNNAICRQTSVAEEDKPGMDRGKIRNPMCARCSAHGLQNRLRGHKKRCPHALCQCHLCKLVDERRDLMAKQIKLRRQQRNELSRRESDADPNPFRPPAPIHERRQTFPDYSGRRNMLPPSLLPRFNQNGALSGPVSPSTINESLLEQHKLQMALLPSPHKDLAQSGTTHLVPSNGGNHLYLPPPPPPLLRPLPPPPSLHGNGRSHGACLGCLEERLRHELKMAELMRLLAFTGATGPELDHQLHHHHPPQQPETPRLTYPSGLLLPTQPEEPRLEDPRLDFVLPTSMFEGFKYRPNPHGLPPPSSVASSTAFAMLFGAGVSRH